MATLDNFRLDSAVHRTTLCSALSFSAWMLLATWGAAAQATPTGSLEDGHHKFQVSDPAVAEELANRGAKLIADYGAFSIYDAPAGALDFNATPGVIVRDEYNSILLNATHLDTSKPETQALRKTMGSFTGKRLHLVQFGGPVQPEWHQQLLEAGLAVVTHIPHHAYLVYGDDKAIASLQALAGKSAHIQWEGAYVAEYKLDPAVRPVDEQGNPRTLQNLQFGIQMYADPEANAETLRLIDQVKLAPIAKQHQVLQYQNVIVTLPAESLALIAARPDVVSIQPYVDPQKYDERQDQIIAGNLSGTIPSGPGYLSWLQAKGFTQNQFTTSGFAVDLSDSGIDNGTTNVNHPGLRVLGMATNPSRVVYSRIEGQGFDLAGCDGHGNLNAHVIAGYNDLVGFPFTDDVGYHWGLGVCPWVKVGASVIFAPGFTSPDYTGLQARAYRDGARVSNNSWGANLAGRYDTRAQEYDSLVRDAQPSISPVPNTGNQEMVIVFANGNSGPGRQSVGNPASAKNVISVGASENVLPIGEPDFCFFFDSDADNADDMASYSSRGPCADGRHKPELVAPGTRVVGGVAQAPNPGPLGTAYSCYNGFGICGSFEDGLFFPTNQEFYTISTGTSHAAPAVAGGCALVRQYFINNYGGAPSAAMTKAYLMNTTRFISGAGAGSTLWSESQGMGEMNLGMAFDDARRILRDQAQVDLFTASGQVRTYTGSIKDPTKPFRVTIAWTDAPGSTAGAAYANNLDLIVTVAGQTFYGNLFSGAYSTPGGQPDVQNNVESVFLPPGLSGPFTITVMGTDINSDGVPNNVTPLDQDFAMVVYNALPPPPQINSLTPTTLLVLVGQPAVFTVSATSSDPITYQWRKNGNPIGAANSNVLTIASAQLTDAATYSVLCTDINGTSTSPNVTLGVVPTVPLPFALNNTNFVWTVSTNTPWFGQTNLSHDGAASGQSYFVQQGDQSTLRGTIMGPGAFSFWLKIVSPTNGARCDFRYYGSGYTNGNQMVGPIDWTNQLFYLGTGTQTVEFAYQNVFTPVARTNGAYLDQVSFTPGATLPFIITQPASQGTLGASPVSFNVVASGTPALSYQWFFNNVAITNATNSVFSIAAAGPTDVGLYTVRVVNGFGTAVSQPASLQVVPLLLVGANDYGQSSNSILATNAVGVSAGAVHSLVARADGRVLAWGDNAAGQCSLPRGLTDVMAVAGGGSHSLALRGNGTVTGWGDNSYGQATPPVGLANVTAIAAGNWHSVALRIDGTVVAWGDNSIGQLNVPAGLNNVVAIAAGGDHTLALKADGTVVAWGSNVDPQWNFAGQSTVPWGLTTAAGVAAGDFHSLTVRKDGTVLGWGYDIIGETSSPTNMNVIAVAAGNQFSLALLADRTVIAWGNNWNGQCDLPPGLTNVTGLAAGDAHTLMLLGKPVTTPEVVRSVRQGTQFNVWVQTVAGLNYALESSTTLAPGSWTTVMWVNGNGSRQLLADPAATVPYRFYRVRQWQF